MRFDIEQRAADCKTLQSFWRSLIPGVYPSLQQLALWLDTADTDAVIHGIRQTAKKFHTLCGRMDQEYQVRYCSSVIKNFRAEQSGSAPRVTAQECPQC